MNKDKKDGSKEAYNDAADLAESMLSERSKREPLTYSEKTAWKEFILCLRKRAE
jgi:hypothetical protein